MITGRSFDEMLQGEGYKWIKNIEISEGDSNLNFDHQLYEREGMLYHVEIEWSWSSMDDNQTVVHDYHITPVTEDERSRDK